MLVNTHTDNHQIEPAIEKLSDGGFIVVWSSENQDTSKKGIFAQKYSVDGTQNGEEFQVNTYILNNQYNPDVKLLTNGDFVISWSSENQETDGTGYGIFAQLYNADGSVKGDEFQVNTFVDGYQSTPVIEAIANGGFIIAWGSENQDASDFGVFAKVFSNDGVADGDDIQINTTTYSEQSTPDISVLSDGNLIVTWQSNSHTSGGFDYDIFGQVIDLNGLKIGGEFQVNTHTYLHQSNVSVASLNDGFVVTWDSKSQDGSGWGVYAQRFDNEGTALGEEFKVNTYTNSEQKNSTVASLNDGGFIVSWSSNSQEEDNAGYGIYAQRFNKDGVTIDDEFHINTYIDKNQSNPSLVSLENGDLAVSWTSNSQDTNGEGIYAHIYEQYAVKPSINYEIHTDETHILTGTSLKFFDDNRQDLLKNKEVVEGGIKVDERIDFTKVELVEPQAFDFAQAINLDDVIGLLKGVAGLDELTGQN
jgi:hypothetical protein